MASLLPVFAAVICLMICGVNTTVTHLTKKPFTETAADKSLINNGTYEYQYNMSHLKDLSHKAGVNVTSGMVAGHKEAIHSVVIEGTFGVDLTKKINETFEYLFEFLYNATELEVSLIALIECGHDYSNNLGMVYKNIRT